MRNALAGLMVAAFTFIQFRNPATNEPLVVMVEQQNAETGQTEVVPKLDENGNTLPVGVKAYGPGSKVYRNAESVNASASLKAGKKGLTGESLFNAQTELLSRTIFEYVNFDYNGEKAGLETNRKLFTDVEYAAVREQVAEKQSDLGNFLPKASSV